ncbi:MAG: hypothetical protein M1821_004060 [Bathelium mastoideum]|nr:MAG: hypothetical protein M1821_004060 [Bathelium mastoideum]KAI9691128.1 MAG: hypothetical protein M1822_008748 [Bathelium mastoideum]
MDILLNKVTQQAMNYAIRSGISITSGYAIRHCVRLLNSTPRSTEREELARLQSRLESKIRIISPAIDMIELIAARGNTTLESAVTLTKSIRWDIQNLGIRLSKAANDQELRGNGTLRVRPQEETELTLKLVISDIKKLLDRIEDAVPLINLAITTSGVNLSTSLPSTVSPSRLLQASAFLAAGDSRYTAFPGHAVQIGPTYTLSTYMLFASHIGRSQEYYDVRDTTWKEVMHKARVKLLRVPLDQLYRVPDEEVDDSTHDSGRTANSSGPSHLPGEAKAYEFAYHLLLVEDLDDGRYHSFEDEEAKPEPFEDVALAGLRHIIPIHQISKIFYADTGKILNINTEGEVNNPILLLKRDPHAEAPRRMMERRKSTISLYDDAITVNGDDPIPNTVNSEDEQSELNAQIQRESSVAPEQDDAPKDQRKWWQLPPGLDLEWIAFEVYTEPLESDDEDTDQETTGTDSSPSAPRQSSRHSSLDPSFTNALSHLHLSSSSPAASPQPLTQQKSALSTSAQPFGPGQVKTSLSLLEMLIRLTALQQFRQDSHLSIDDELLNFFLEDSSTTGAGPNPEHRQYLRQKARQRVGFDPYDESPLKRDTKENQNRPPPPDDTWPPSAYAWDADTRLRSPSAAGGWAPSDNESWSPRPGPASPRPPSAHPPASSPGTMPSSPSPGYFGGGRAGSSSRAGTPARSPRAPSTPITPPGTGTTRSTAPAREARGLAKVKSPLGMTMTMTSDTSVGTSPTLAGSEGEDLGGKDHL